MLKFMTGIDKGKGRETRTSHAQGSMHIPVSDDCLRGHQRDPPIRRVDSPRRNQSKGPRVKLLR